MSRSPPELLIFRTQHSWHSHVTQNAGNSEETSFRQTLYVWNSLRIQLEITMLEFDMGCLEMNYTVNRDECGCC